MIETDVNTHLHDEALGAVLDTQAVLDWLYFEDPETASWHDHLLAGAWQWWASTALRDELAHVLGRGSLPAPRVRQASEVLALFDARAQLLPQPAAMAHGPLRCTDPDDQKFIDLATHHQARWLVSRDRAVLKVRRRAAALHGLTVLPPVAWSVALQARR